MKRDDEDPAEQGAENAPVRRACTIKKMTTAETATSAAAKSIPAHFPRSWKELVKVQRLELLQNENAAVSDERAR
jgi:hypothetical protein